MSNKQHETENLNCKNVVNLVVFFTCHINFNYSIKIYRSRTSISLEQMEFNPHRFQYVNIENI
jgi:hypothetical protein